MKQTLPAFFEDYLDEKFKMVLGEIAGVKSDVYAVKTDIKEVKHSVEDLKKKMESLEGRSVANHSKIKMLGAILGAIALILISHVGLEEGGDILKAFFGLL